MTKIALMLLAGATVSTAALADNTAMTRDEVRSMVSEMLSDAETRSSLLQGGGMAGYDKGFMIGSADGNWKLKFNGLIQFRYIADFRDDANAVRPDGTAPPAPVGAVAADDLANGFQLRKTRVVLSGNAINPNLTYKIAFESNNGTAGGWIANDIYFGYKLDGGWAVRGGQYKSGFLKEELMSEAVTLPMERGMLNQVYSQGRSQGVGITYENETSRCSFDFTDGFNSANTDYNNPVQTVPNAPYPAGSESEFAAAARGEWKWAGSWDALSDFTSKPGDAQAGSLGGAAYWQTGTQPNASGDSNVWGATLDVQWEGNGWSVFAAGVYQNQRQAQFAPGTPIANNYGFMVQGAYRWNETSEVFARWDDIIMDKDGGGFVATSASNCNFLTFGYNHYFAGNNAKLTLDCIYSCNDTTNLAANTSLTNSPNIGFDGTGPTNQGLLGQTDGGEFALRAQFQLAF